MKKALSALWRQALMLFGVLMVLLYLIWGPILWIRNLFSEKYTDSEKVSMTKEVVGLYVVIGICSIGYFIIGKIFHYWYLLIVVLLCLIAADHLRGKNKQK
jgi:cyanate permease